MTKRIALLVVISIFMAWTSAVAEDFTFRNRITFKNTIAQVTEKENKQLGTHKLLRIKFDIESNTSPKFQDYCYAIYSESGVIVEIPESYIGYKFNSQEILREATYSFKTYDTSQHDIALKDFEHIEQAIMTKYGDPINQSVVSKMYPVRSYSLNYDIDYYSLDLNQPANNRYFDFSERIIDCQEYKVKIDHYIILTQYDVYVHRLCYSYFTDEDLLAVLESEQTNSILDDL